MLVFVRLALEVEKIVVTHRIDAGFEPHTAKVVAERLRFLFVGGNTKSRDALKAAQRIDYICFVDCRKSRNA